MTKCICSLLLCTILLNACGHIQNGDASDENTLTVIDSGEIASDARQTDYTQEIEEWRSNRIKALKQPRSWTSLVGLTWLKEGENAFGSGSSNDITINGKVPEDVGTWTVNGDSIRLKVHSGIDVRLSDQTLFREGHVRADADGNPHFFHLGSMFWTIIKRSELYGVRVWDTTYHLRSELIKIPHYKTDRAWNFEATVIPTNNGETITMDNAVGQSIEYPVAGNVIASKGDINIELIALDGGPDNLFLIFSDLTTDIETYPGGRYMYIPRPDSLGRTVIDFNKAYNPPCAFTAFATCLLPPKSNFVDAEVLAGEKDYGEHSTSR